MTRTDTPQDVGGVHPSAKVSSAVRSEDARIGALRIHVAHGTSGSRAGVLLYPTINGLDETMRARASSLASAGMTAVLWDPYDGEDGSGDVWDFPGQTMDEFALAASIRGPVQVCRPGHDLNQPAEYRRLLDALHARHDPTFYEYYPEAEHMFSHKPGQANERAHRFAWAATLSVLSMSLEQA